LLDEFLKVNKNSVLVVIFNFTRQQECTNIYQALEELKDGMVTSEKYKGRTIYFDYPHLVCLANYIPNISSMSKDRWDIRTIQNEMVVSRYLSGVMKFEHPSITAELKLKIKKIGESYSNIT